MDSNGTHAKDKRADSDAKSKDNTPSAANTPTDTNKSPRKRRKVNHACVYCRRSHMTCDLPKTSNHAAARDESDGQTELSRNSIDRGTNAMVPPSFDSSRPSQGTKPGFGPLGQGNPLQLVSPSPVSGGQASVAGFSDAWLTAQNQFHDMHHFNPQYMLPQEVTHEFNLLNDFLNTSLLDENGTLTDEQSIYRNQSQSGQVDMVGFLGNPLPPSAMEAGSMLPPNSERNAIPRPRSAAPPDKTREFYLQAADPSGNDTPEARMQRVLKAKYDAGLLKPFNYIKGYARLSSYMDGHIAPASKQKILRQLDRFRPKFREKMQGLTDMELVYVEMWFERSLMEYDRVFASMAVPACCWRRSGEIFRGNKEMAELIHVPVERLRDGKLSIHEVMTEESLVRYWEEFGTIAFDPAHDTLLTACALKNPDDRSNDPTVNCCFSFMIRRDDHKIRLRSLCLDKVTDSTLVDLNKGAEDRIQSLKTHSPRSLHAEQHTQLKTASLKLWNWCTQELRRGDDNTPPQRPKFLTLVRVLSLSMLDLAQRDGDNCTKTITHLERLAIKTSRSCIASNELEYALWTLQKAVEYNGLLQRMQGSPSEEPRTCSQFEAEYSTLRIVLAWKEDRMDVAEHLYASVAGIMTKVDTASAEQLADALFEIGRDLNLKKNSVLAAKWLERALELINSQEMSQLSRDAIELKLAISQALIQAYLDVGSPDYINRAENHIAYLEDGLGDKLVVLLFRTEVLLRSPAETFDSKAYASILHRMMKAADISESSFKLIMHHIRKLDEKDNIALRQEDVDSALRCLEQISAVSSSDPNYLYACCLEAQQAQDRITTIKALQLIVDKDQLRSSNAIHLPALLRTLIRLEISVLNEEQKVDTDTVTLATDICNIFKAAAQAIETERRDIKSEKLFTIDELNWFSKNAYNLGLENALTWEARYVIVILECCLSIISSYPSDISSQMAADISLRGMFCDFMIATMLLALARSEDNTEQRLQDYLNMRRHILHFREELESRSDALDQASREDLQTKLSTLLDDLKGIVLTAQPGRNPLTYQAMADCILRCQLVPNQVLYQTMREIIDQTWKLEHFGYEKLAKYMRCLLKATLPMEHHIPLNLMGEISNMAKELANMNKEFPPLELEWITVTAFNHGVDLYGAHEDDLSKAWISHALTIAHYLRDDNELEKQLQDRYTKLKWDEAQPTN
ncbi:meiosis protein SPO22/ZIP4 like-domain-containing protein [Xylaria bambusicola]|uniref:meiosis protein SPO22/ZIP4 like-domain-containing protein n=1 Tax=Xylaria bambusicola TaxID=326684 RepID=UPI002007640E|nr:meiosis protein SPO22/ZIP4 like-domain-containing protein [Xylaria bambusicola]KAI0503144.1 meiosis protein SPO22/ZIP4 like-domain-containing protein [Xylaria bambusicola]